MNDDLILDNVNLIHLVINKKGLHNYADQYFDYGMDGLIKAARTFDPDKGYKFSTYAVRCITNEINKYFVHLNAKKNIAKRNTISLDTMTYDSDGQEIGTLYDIIPSDFNLEESVINKDRMERLINAIRTLPEKERKIITLLLKGVTRNDVAKIMGVSITTITVYKKRVIKKLRRRLKDD